MTIQDIINIVEEAVPLYRQEEWDNSGYQVVPPSGAKTTCTGVVLALEANVAVLEEAVTKGCNLVITHHPLIFKGLKKLTGANDVQRTVAFALCNGIAVYSTHTALDSAPGGVSAQMAKLLGADVQRPLAPQRNAMVKLSVSCPREDRDAVESILLDSEVASCTSSEAERVVASVDSDTLTYSLDGTPVCKIEIADDEPVALMLYRRLRTSPDASSWKFNIEPLRNDSSDSGLGVVASFPEAVPAHTLVERIKEVFGCSVIRSSAGYDADAMIHRVALCGGSGGEFIPVALAAGAQVYITADVRYHDFVDSANMAMAIFDIGHFESEKCFKTIIYNIITNKLPNFAVYYADLETNPVKYL